MAEVAARHRAARALVGDSESLAAQLDVALSMSDERAT